MITETFDRRALLRGGAAGAALLALPACVSTGLPGLDLSSLLKDLLSLSSQRAFARLLQDDGFLNDDLVALGLPPELTGTGGLLASLLATPMIRNRMLSLVNDAAGEAAEFAAPIVEDSIRSLTFADAAAILNGGPQAATGVLQNRIGLSLAERLVPSSLLGLRDGDADILGRVLGAVTGYDIDRLAVNVGQQASSSIFKAIGREEAWFRANPQEIPNPALRAALMLG